MDGRMMNKKCPTVPFNYRYRIYPVPTSLKLPHTSQTEEPPWNYPPSRYQEDFDGFVMAYDKVKVHGKEVSG